METPKTPELDASADRNVDPATDLELLDRAQHLIEVDQILDFGPWWYAPLLATLIGGLSLFGQDTTDATNVAAGVVAIGAAVVMSIHDHRRRGVRHRSSVTGKGIATVGLSVFIGLAFVASWGTAVSTLGYDRFFPGYAALGWVLTTLALLGIRAWAQTIRRRRRMQLR